MPVKLSVHFSLRTICLLLLLLGTGCRSTAQSGAEATPVPSGAGRAGVAAPVAEVAEPSEGVVLPPTAPPAEPTRQVAAPRSVPTLTADEAPAVTATRIVSTPAPQPTASPTPNPVPTLRQLTTGGCCTQPFWTPDSERVLFIDKPRADAPVGIWGVDVAGAAAPTLFTERIATYTPDLAYVLERQGGTTIIERVSDGERWTVPSGSSNVSLSPDRTRIAWQVSDSNLPFEQRVAEVWLLRLDGGEPERALTLPRGSLSGWIGNDALLVSSRASAESREQILSAYSLRGGEGTELVRTERLGGVLLSPGGGWMAYTVTLHPDTAQNGVWLARTDGSQRYQVERALFGSYQWRSEGQLLIVPFQLDALSHELWQLDASSGDAARLADQARTPFKIANGNWTVAPDGHAVAFLASHDRNLWLLTLP